MPKCLQCGRDVSVWSMDLFTGACRKCHARSIRNLGCGTLILLALIAWFFSRSGTSDLESKMFRLQISLEELRKASDEQTKELRELRKAVDDLRKDSVGKDKQSRQP